MVISLWCRRQKRLRYLDQTRIRLEKPLGRHRERQWLSSGVTTCTLRNFYLSHLAPIKRKAEQKKRAQAHANSGGAFFLQRRFCGFAKSGKLRDPEASERFAGGSEKFGFPSNSSQPLPGARASQAIARAGPMKGRLASYMCSALEY